MMTSISILLQNAEIVDGTNSPSYRGDIAIAGDRIADIGSLQGVTARTVIDVAGRVVVPGFIDMHSHADLSLLAAPEGESLVHQGITTVVAGQCGLSPAPLTSKSKKEALRTFNTVGAPKASIPWEHMSSFGAYLDYLERIRPAINVVPLVGQGMIRAAVLGYSARQPTTGQIEQMQKLVDEAMDSGAFGISTGLIYPPGSFTPTAELIQVVRPVARRNGLYFSHIRGESETLIEAIQEAIEIGRQAGVAVQISHFKAAGMNNWDKAATALQWIDRARSEGLDITADMYPYLAGSTHLAVLLPPWAIEGGVTAVLRRLILPWERNKIVQAIQAGQGGLVQDIEWDKILINKSRKKEYLLRTVAELAAREGKDPCTWILDALVKTLGDITMAILAMSEDNVRMQLRHPAMMIGTDGFALATEGPMASGMLHPRSFGTYPRLFGQYVREEGILSLAEASWKASGFPAQKLRLADRGAIKKGYKADLVVLDPATIQDRATYTDPLQYPAGIETVLVNGEVAIDQGRRRSPRSPTAARPGKVIRKGP